MQSIKVHQVSKYWLLLTLQKLHRLLCFSFTGICMQNMQSTVFTQNFLVGNCMSTCNVHIQKHSSKKHISFFPFIVYYRRYSRNTVYSMIEQKKFYSFVTVNKISMKHTRAFWTKKQRQKAHIKREGTKKSTTFLYLISAIFRVRPHVFININQLCVNYSIVCLLSAEIYCFGADIIAEEVFRLYLRFGILFLPLWDVVC